MNFSTITVWTVQAKRDLENLIKMQRIDQMMSTTSGPVANLDTARLLKDFNALQHPQVTLVQLQTRIYRGKYSASNVDNWREEISQLAEERKKLPTGTITTSRNESTNRFVWSGSP